MRDRDEFLQWVQDRLVPAETALHNGDPGPRFALWSTVEPLSVLGAGRNAVGRDEVASMFRAIAGEFSDCRSYSFEIVTADVVGDMAFTAGLEHIQASVRGEARTYTLRATQIYRREGGEWKAAHRHADTV